MKRFPHKTLPKTAVILYHTLSVKDKLSANNSTLYLWQRAQTATTHALASGALQPIQTQPVWIKDDHDHMFLIHLAPQLTHKIRATKEQVNPFLPYDPDLFVADISETYVCLLNKYHVLPHHLLLVTRHFEEQESWLTAADFAALATGLTEINGLGFYNSGRAAGASQQHKHLQIVPLPLATGGPAIPITPLVATAVYADAIGHTDALPFRHAITCFQEGDTAVAAGWTAVMHSRYRALMHNVGLRPDPPPPQPAPYNLLVTREWMMVIPRRRQKFQTISVNALGFAGSLLARDEADIHQLQSAGVLSVLQQVAVEK